MKRNAWMAATIACAMSAAAAAQSGSSATKAKTDTMSDEKPITVTGCLQADTSHGSSGSTMGGGYMLSNAMMTDAQKGSTTGGTTTTGTTAGTTAGGTTAGTTGTTATGTTATGTTATGTPATGTTATGTTGTSTNPATAGTTGTATGTVSGGASMPHSASSYMLEGRDSELKNHVGHRVEVTGTLDRSKDAGARHTTATASGSTGTADSAQHLRVSSVRMIASDCSAK